MSLKHVWYHLVSVCLCLICVSQKGEISFVSASHEGIQPMKEEEEALKALLQASNSNVALTKVWSPLVICGTQNTIHGHARKHLFFFFSLTLMSEVLIYFSHFVSFYVCFIKTLRTDYTDPYLHFASKHIFLFVNCWHVILIKLAALAASKVSLPIVNLIGIFTGQLELCVNMMNSPKNSATEGSPSHFNSAGVSWQPYGTSTTTSADCRHLWRMLCNHDD